MKMYTAVLIVAAVVVVSSLTGCAALTLPNTSPLAGHDKEIAMQQAYEAQAAARKAEFRRSEAVRLSDMPVRDTTPRRVVLNCDSPGTHTEATECLMDQAGMSWEVWH